MIRRVALSLVLLLLAAGGAVAASQEEEEEITGMRLTDGKLVLQTADEVYLAPNGIFVHESGAYRIAFSKGQGTQYGFSGSDEEMREVDIDRLEVGGGQLAIYLEQGRLRNKAVRSVSPEDGVWKDRKSGAELVIKDGRIIKCKGLEKS